MCKVTAPALVGTLNQFKTNWLRIQLSIEGKPLEGNHSQDHGGQDNRGYGSLQGIPKHNILLPTFFHLSKDNEPFSIATVAEIALNCVNWETMI